MWASASGCCSSQSCRGAVRACRGFNSSAGSSRKKTVPSSAKSGSGSANAVSASGASSRLVCLASAGAASAGRVPCRGASSATARRASRKALSALRRAVLRALLPGPRERLASVRLALEKLAEYMARARSGRLWASSMRKSQSPEASKKRRSLTTGSNR